MNVETTNGPKAWMPADVARRANGLSVGLTQAVVLVMYGDPDIAAHFASQPGNREMEQRASKILRPHLENARLEFPGLEEVNRARATSRNCPGDVAKWCEVVEEVRRWAARELPKIEIAKTTLRAALDAGRIIAYSNGQPIEDSHWVSFDLDTSPLRLDLRFRLKELQKFVRSLPEAGVQSAPSGRSLAGSAPTLSPASGPQTRPGGLAGEFIRVPDAIERIIELEEPGLLAAVHRDWLDTPAEQRPSLFTAPLSAEEMERRAGLFDHPSSILRRTHDEPCRIRRARLAVVRERVEQTLWLAFVEGGLPLVISPGHGPVRIPPEVLPANGRARVLGGEEVYWRGAYGEANSHRGHALVDRAEFDRWLKTDVVKCGLPNKAEQRGMPAAEGRGAAPISSRGDERTTIDGRSIQTTPSAERPADAKIGDAPPQVKFGALLPSSIGPSDPLESDGTGVATAPPARSESVKATSSKPPFSAKAAKIVLVALKMSRQLQERPIEPVAIAIVARNFQTAPRDPVRDIVTDIWGPGKRGPRKSAK